MILYFITQNANFGNEITLFPRIPKSIDFINHEDNKTPRICVSHNILGALKSIQNNLYGAKTFLYYTDIKDKDILYFPTVKEVPDVNETNEVWILEKSTFIKICEYNYNSNIYEIYNYFINNLKM